MDIEVATVHSVKGETHIATLYMETFYHTGTESKLFSERFNGIMNNPLNSYAQDAIKVAYVGMSRPRYLLYYVVRKDHFIEYLDSHYVRDVWDIRNI